MDIRIKKETFYRKTILMQSLYTIKSANATANMQ